MVKLAPPLVLKGTRPDVIPVYTPNKLPSCPVFTCRGWMHFDKWGRVCKIKPQPDRPETYDSLFKLCTYQELKKQFLFLPPVPMSTDAQRKKKMAVAKEKMKVFFLPHKEKRKQELLNLVNKQARKRQKKLTRAQKDKERESANAFADAFATSEKDLPPGPPTDESESESEHEFEC